MTRPRIARLRDSPLQRRANDTHRMLVNHPSSVAYHQLARSNGRARAVGELVLAVVFWFVIATIIGMIGASVTGISLSKSDGALGLVALAAVLGAAVPATWLAARLVGRNPRQLSSVANRLRWP